MASEEDGVFVLRREHAARVEAQAEAGRVRTGQQDRRGKLAARVTPAEFWIGNIALIAIWRAEVLAHLGEAVELIFRNVLRHPVAAVVREIELLGRRIPIEPP